MQHFNLGVNLLQADLDDYLGKLAALGYTHLYYNGGIFARSEADLQHAARLCADHGILPFAAHAPGQFLPNDPDQLDTWIERHKRVFDKASILGCRSITFHVGSVDGVRNEETAAYIAKVGRTRFDDINFRTVAEIAAYAHTLGMQIAVENLSRDIVNNYVRTIDDIKRVLAGAGNPAGAGICVDAGHANISGLRAADLIREAGSLLIETHFNDNFGWLSTENAINDIHRPPGIGTVDWVAVVEALDQVGYTHPVIFELGPKFEEDRVDSFIYLALENWRQFERVYRFQCASLPVDGMVDEVVAG